MAAERLQKVLSHAGVASRRKAEDLITGGHVAVNGIVITELGARADPVADDIAVDGVPIAPARYRYLLLNKPPGAVTTVSDEHGRPTVLDLARKQGHEGGVHPVGRLDQDSEGLLILTNDGRLTELLTHPRHQVEKEYLVRLDRQLSAREQKRMRTGIEIDSEKLKATSVATVRPPGAAEEAWVAVVLRHGRKREVRRMIESLGANVLELRRVRVANLALGDLEPGNIRELTPHEVQELYRVALSAGKAR